MEREGFGGGFTEGFVFDDERERDEKKIHALLAFDDPLTKTGKKN